MSDKVNSSAGKASMNNYKMPGMRGPRNRQEVEKPQEGKKTIKRLIQYFSEERFLVFELILVIFVVVCCSVYAPKLQSKGIDLITDGAFDSLSSVLLTMLVVYLIYCLGTFLQSRISAILSQKIVGKMRKDLFQKIVNLPISYLDRHSHGDIMSRMTNDIENISNTVSQSISSMFSGILTITGTVIMMLYLCWQLAILSCCTVILTVLVTKLLSKSMKMFYRRRQVLLGELNGNVEEMIGGYKTVVAYNRQQAIMEEFNQVSDDLTRTGIIAETLGNAMGPLMNVINNIGFVIIAAFGGYYAVNGVISIGIISAFIIYAKQFGRPIDELAQIYGQIQTALAGAERVFAILDTDSEDKSGSQTIDHARGNITFKDVCFSYEPGREILHHMNFEIKAGHKIAIVGATGSGKTTVVNLLMRFYDVDSGEILIDGINIKDVDCDNLRNNMAIVLQNAVLFTDTVKNNLIYSNANATEEQIEQAAAMSNCKKMIEHLTNGYDTILTQAGHNLSQGQRQLLTIARAFLADPKILILDEATSSVDTRTEKHIQDAMVKLMQNRTSLIIAHRLSTIQDADCIVVMDQGNIVETGNHEELLQQKGRYYELYMTQFAGKAI